MELCCDQEREQQREGGGNTQLNPRAREFHPVRRAAVVAAENIRRIADEEAAEH